jgi:hypothetical protein
MNLQNLVRDSLSGMSGISKQPAKKARPESGQPYFEEIGNKIYSVREFVRSRSDIDSNKVEIEVLIWFVYVAFL